jgi:hypothetical protein
MAQLFPLHYRPRTISTGQNGTGQVSVGVPQFCRHCHVSYSYPTPDAITSQQLAASLNNNRQSH